MFTLNSHVNFLLTSLLFAAFANTANAQDSEATDSSPDTQTESVEESEPVIPPPPPTVSIPIVYTGGSMGIGAGEYTFELPQTIQEALPEGGTLQNVRAYHGVAAQGPYHLIAHDRRVSTLNDFLKGGFITCGEPNPITSQQNGREQLFLWSEGIERSWTTEIFPQSVQKSYSVCSNANEETAILVGPPLSTGPDIMWRVEAFEFRLGLNAQIRINDESVGIDIIGIPKSEPARRFKMLLETLNSQPDTLYVDAGSFVDGASSVRAGALSLHRPTGFAILERLKPVALVPGETELAGGAATFLLEAAAHDLDYIATNWTSEDPNLALAPSMTKTIDTEMGPIHIAFLGALDPNIHRWSPQIKADGVQLTEPIAAIDQEVQRLQSTETPPDIVILLTTMGPNQLSELRNNLKNIDLILGDTSSKSERLRSFSIELQSSAGDSHTATTLPVNGIASAKLKFESLDGTKNFRALDVDAIRFSPDVIPDTQVVSAISKIRSAEYPAYDNPLLPGIDDGVLSDDNWAKIVCEAIAAHTTADAVFLPQLPNNADIPGPLTELLVMDRLALLDQLEVHYIPGDRFPNFLQKVYGLMPIHCGADVGSKWPKARGRFLEAERLYRVVTTDRARLSTNLGVLLQEAYSPRILDKPGYTTVIGKDGEPVRLSSAVLQELRLLREQADNPLTITTDLLARKPSDKHPMWLAKIRRVALNIERFKGAEDSAYESIPETLATSGSSFTLGGQIDAAMDYSSRLLLSDLRLRSNYTRFVLQEDEPQETADDIILSSSISLPGASFPKIGNVGFMPYSEGMLDSEFTAVESEETEVPRQADLSLAFGISARRFGAVRTLRLGAFALRDLSVPEKSMEFGARGDFETRHVFGPGLLFTTLWNGSVWGNTPEDDESDLRFKLLLDTRLSLPLARYLNIAVYGQGFLFKGRVPETSSLGASYSIGVSFDVIGSFLLEALP